MELQKILVELSDEDAAALADLARRCSQADDQASEGATSHGPLENAAAVLAMLAEDAAMVIRRPGSWEGAGLIRQLAAHGYDI